MNSSSTLFKASLIAWLTAILCFQTHAQGWYEIDSAVSGINNNDQFGWSADMNAEGNRFMVGARFHEIPNGNGQMVNGGGVYVFDINGNQFNQLGGVIEADRPLEQFAICAMSGDGDRIAIGGPHHGLPNDSTSIQRGEVRIYEWNGTDWQLLGDTLYGDAAYDQFGYSVSLSHDGNRLIAGATQNSADSSNSGYIKVFEFDGINWSLVGNKLFGSHANDLFGMTVDMDSLGKRIAVGSPYFDGQGLLNNGKVNIYDWTGSDWVSVGDSIEYPYYGLQTSSSMAISSDGTHIISASRFEPSGSVFVHEFDGVDWIQKGAELMHPTTINYGRSVAINNSGSRIAIGSFENGVNDNKGMAKVLDWNGTSWEQFGQIVTGNPYDFFGTVVRISGNGNYLLSTSLGGDCDNGFSCGNTRIFGSSGAAIGEISIPNQKKVRMIVDALGREIEKPSQGFFIEVYEDGSSRRYFQSY